MLFTFDQQRHGVCTRHVHEWTGMAEASAHRLCFLSGISRSYGQGGVSSTKMVTGMEARPYMGAYLLFGLLCSEDVDILSQLRALSLKGGLAPRALCLGCRCCCRAALGDILAALACEEAAQKAQQHISSLQGMTQHQPIMFSSAVNSCFTGRNV